MLLVRHGGDRHVKKIVREPKWGTSSPSVIVLESVNGYFTRTHVNFRNTIAYGDIEIYRSYAFCSVAQEPSNRSLPFFS